MSIQDVLNMIFWIVTTCLTVLYFSLRRRVDKLEKDK